MTEANAHPHLSGNRVAVIHNGIIENYQPIKDELIAKGYSFCRKRIPKSSRTWCTIT